MDPSLGARLREQRERQQISLGAIAEATKIKLSILEGLERDDVSQWPEGIYRRAYVRAYARAVGLDPDALVREFLHVHPDPIVAQSPADAELEEPPWPAGIRRLVTSAIAAIPSRRSREDRDTDAPERLPTGPEPRDPLGPVLTGPTSDALAEAVESPARREAASAASTESRDDGLRRGPTLQDAAAMCTRLARARDTRDAVSILEAAANACDALGVIVWAWHSRAEALRPALAHGYSTAMLARLPDVPPDADNAVASAFRTNQPCIVDGSEGVTGAVVVPLASDEGCVGALAMELRQRGERREDVQAFASILAAQLVPLLASAALAEAVNS